MPQKEFRVYGARAGRLTPAETEELTRGLRATMEADPQAAAMFRHQTTADGE